MAPPPPPPVVEVAAANGVVGVAITALVVAVTFWATKNEIHFIRLNDFQLQPLLLKCDPQSSMSRSPTSILTTVNQNTRIEKTNILREM